VRAISLVVCLLLSGCAHALPASQPPPAAVARVRPSFELRHDSASERATAAQLDRLFNAYDLTPWHQGDVDAAVVELRAIAPGLPVGFPGGAQSETSSYEQPGHPRISRRRGSATTAGGCPFATAHAAGATHIPGCG